MAKKKVIKKAVGALKQGSPELVVTHILLAQCMQQLEIWLAHIVKGEEPGDAAARLWGERESFLSAFTKLAQLQMKLLELEKSNATQSAATVEKTTLSDEEWDMLKHAAESRVPSREQPSSV